jgi:anti-anti-sigma factor
MDIQVTHKEHTLQASLSGNLSYEDSRAFRQLLHGVAEHSGDLGAIVVDLSQLENIDSAGLGMLILLHDKAKEHQASVTLKHPQERVANLLTIAKFDSMFEVQH